MKLPADRTNRRNEVAPLLVGVLAMLVILAILGYALMGVLADAVVITESVR